MLIRAKMTWSISFFFSPKEAQLLFRQLQKLSARNIASLKCESRKTKCWVPWFPLMQLSVNDEITSFNQIELVFLSDKLFAKIYSKVHDSFLLEMNINEQTN